ncbi:hypothetical protein XENORESO_001738 [Xenotaenia resolanae]|uniref:Uncharacterized protein n=1 Tax=Xenotaenia resolanae TaxID=208358 RepID=A0ABV0WI10_9TELE
MAPIGMDIVMSWFSSPEVGIISLVAFFILSITLLALCARCNRGSNAYDVNGTMTDGGANGNIKAGDADVETQTAWRDHKSMPASTLRRH